MGRSVGKPIAVRLDIEAEHALDAAAAADPDNPSRSELIRRIVTEWLEQRERPGMAAVKPASATAPAVAEKAARVRSKAASAADDAMSGMDASDDVKASRRKALTEKPAMVAKARAKRKS